MLDSILNTVIIMSKLTERMKQVIVYGGHGREERRHKFKDEFGHEFTGTGPEAKSYFRGRNQALSIVFKQFRKRK